MIITKYSRLMKLKLTFRATYLKSKREMWVYHFWLPI